MSSESSAYFNPSESCIWYGTACSEKRCDGGGYVSCRVRKTGAVSDKLTGKYRNIRTKVSEISQIRCLSLSLESRASSSETSISA